MTNMFVQRLKTFLDPAVANYEVTPPHILYAGMKEEGLRTIKVSKALKAK